MAEKQLMQRKKQTVDFLENGEWLNDLSFFINITEMLAKRNVQLQEKWQTTLHNY